MKVLIVIPTYNEAENIQWIVEKVLCQGKQFSVLVVDDNSPDKTSEIVEEFFRGNSRVHLLKRPGKLGLGRAYCEGFKYALEKNFDFVGQLDADFSHNPEYLPSMLECCLKKGMVIGSRYVSGGGVKNWPYRRYILSYCANLYARLITGVPIKDLTAGFSIIKASSLKDIYLDEIFSNGFAFQIELKNRIYCNQRELMEFPILFDERRSGQSKLNGNIIVEAVFAPFRIRWREFFQKG